MGRKFKFQVQDSDLEHLLWQCEKNIALSEVKPPVIKDYNFVLFKSTLDCTYY